MLQISFLFSYFWKNEFDFLNIKTLILLLQNQALQNPHPTIAVFSRNLFEERRGWEKKSMEEKLSKVLNAFLDCSNSFVICSSYTHLLPIYYSTQKRALDK